MRSARDYKALYKSAQLDSDRRGRLIVLLQQQLTGLAEERHSMLALAREQQEQLTQKEKQITLQQQTIEMQLQTISRQDEKLAVQEALIEEQNQLVATQNRQLEVCRRELSHLNNLRHELKTLKNGSMALRVKNGICLAAAVQSLEMAAINSPCKWRSTAGGSVR